MAILVQTSALPLSHLPQRRLQDVDPGPMVPADEVALSGRGTADAIVPGKVPNDDPFPVAQWMSPARVRPD